MFPAWRLQIREARLALKEGRWDEATRLLLQPAVREFLPARKLSHQLAEQLLQRAGTRMEWGDSSAGWQDVQRAVELGGANEAIAKLRSQRTHRGLTAVQQFLEQGEPQLALDELVRLEQRRLDSTETRQWKLVARLMRSADQNAATGNFRAAADALEHAGELIPRVSMVELNKQLIQQLCQREKQMRRQVKQLQRLNAQLHKLLSRENWTGVLATAEAMIELAPEHHAARRAKRRAWQAVGMDVTRTYHPTNLRPRDSVILRQHHAAQVLRDSTKRLRSAADVDTKTTDPQPGRRTVAWIDAVGGYLLCLGDEVVLGQPTPSTHIDIPILGDISRRHATIRRDGEAYVLTPVHSVSVDGVKLSGPTVLRDKSLLQLGETVKLRFCKPHALSATAVLTIESNHKTEPAVDAVVLMSDNCILGPRSHSHICCRNWPGDLVLMRHEEKLIFRSEMSVELDGEPCNPPAEIPGNCRLECEEFALSFEEI